MALRMIDNFTVWLWYYEFIGKKVDNFPVWIFDNFPVQMFDNFPVSESWQFSGSPSNTTIFKFLPTLRFWPQQSLYCGWAKIFGPDII